MDRPFVWLVILLGALVTLAERGAFLITASERPLPGLLRRALRYVPPAVFAALSLPNLLKPSGIALGPVDVRLLAALAGGLVAWRTRNVTLSFVVGMLTLWTLSWLVA